MKTTPGSRGSSAAQPVASYLRVRSCLTASMGGGWLMESTVGRGRRCRGVVLSVCRPFTNWSAAIRVDLALCLGFLRGGRCDCGSDVRRGSSSSNLTAGTSIGLSIDTYSKSTSRIPSSSSFHQSDARRFTLFAFRAARSATPEIRLVTSDEVAILDTFCGSF